LVHIEQATHTSDIAVLKTQAGESGEDDFPQMESLLNRLTLAASTHERTAIAADVARAVSSCSARSLEACLLTLAAAADGKPAAREAAMLGYAALAHDASSAAKATPILLSALAVIFERAADKTTPVRKAATAASEAIVKIVSKYTTKQIMPTLYSAMDNKKKWQTKFNALSFIDHLAKVAPIQVADALSEIIPEVTAQMWDTKPEIKKLATKVMSTVCSVVDNRDIQPFIPALVSCTACPAEVSECVYKLSATTFVATVEKPALAIMVPLLTRGLCERTPAVIRQTAVIIDNMCKLVDNPEHAEQFLPKLLPGLERVIETAADPELRDVATRARNTLQRVAGVGQEIRRRGVIESTTLYPFLCSMFATVSVNNMVDVVVSYLSDLAAELIVYKQFDAAEWKSTFVLPVIASVIESGEAEECCAEFLMKCVTLDKACDVQAAAVDEEEGEELCNCEFSLAYGGMILLNKTQLQLKRGQRYGLCGANGCGKSTLMRAIANEQVEGFPPKSELRTVYVEHAIQASQAEMAVLDFVVEDELMKQLNVSKDEVMRVLSSVGFTDVMQAQSISSLSGGWKMKLELARAMLQNADILLLDEPTNHLDVSNVKWLEDYLNQLSNVTCLIVSHDAGFLDNVCTGIIHYEHLKLRKYRGNLSEFVKVYPEAQSYYDLEASAQKFVLPEPGFLHGIKSKTKAIMKMTHVDFTYPGCENKALKDVTIQCSLASRIAVIGPNGAGKSTMVKLLTGELVPQIGTVDKHPNLRVAYVAQHAFHHLERHLDKTPCEYIQWRYQGGEDKELLEKDTRQLTEEEIQMMKKVIALDPKDKRQLEYLVSRRQKKKTYEYEIKWVDRPYEDNTFMLKEELENHGFGKLTQAFDDREAALAGLYTRPLTQVNIQKHFEDLGLPAEFSMHSRTRGLSGGQKVKVVLAAAMWNNPHMLVLDEPTNYLDRESLGGLATAIKEFGGGIVLISHNREFTNALCSETWNVNNGDLHIEGQDYTARIEKLEQTEQLETTDAFGNTIKLKSTKKLSRKEIKAKERSRKLKIKNGEPLSSDDEEDW